MVDTEDEAASDIGLLLSYLGPFTAIRLTNV